MGRKTGHSVRDALILFGVLLTSTVVVIILGPQGHVLQEVGALLAGLAVGVWLLRFSPPWRWLAVLTLVLSLVLCLVLGPVGIAWFGGFISGTQAGLAWQRVNKQGIKRRDKERTSRQQGFEPDKRSDWLVDGKEYGSAVKARNAVSEALRSMDGRTKGTLAVERGSARFEVAGGVPTGFVCHWNIDAANEGSWAVLVRDGQTRNESVDVPMGNAKGLMPLRLVNDLESVEAALDNFFKTPASSSFGPKWVTGSEAEGTRLTSF